MAGEVAAAAAGVSPPKQGSTLGDLLTLAGGVAQERERRADKARKSAMEDAMLSLQQRQQDVAERALQHQVEQDTIGNLQRERELKQQEDIAYLNAGIQGEFADAQTEQNKIERLRLKMTQDERDEQEEASARVLMTDYGYTRDRIPRGSAVKTLEYLRGLELEKEKQRGFSTTAALEASNKMFDNAREEVAAAEAAFRDRRATLDAQIDAQKKQPIVTVVGADGKPHTVPGSMISDDQARALAIQGLGVDFEHDYSTARAALEAAQANFDNVKAQFFSAAPVIQGVLGQPGMTGAAGVRGASPADPTGRVAKAQQDTRRLLMKDPLGVAMNLAPQLDAQFGVGPQNPLDQALAESGYTRDAWMKEVVAPAQQRMAQLQAGGMQGAPLSPAGAPAQAPTPPPPQPAVTPAGSVGEPSALPSAHPTTVADARYKEEYRLNAVRTLKGGKATYQETVNTVTSLLDLGYERKQVLNLIPDEALRRMVDERVPTRIGTATRAGGNADARARQRVKDDSAYVANRR